MNKITVNDGSQRDRVREQDMRKLVLSFTGILVFCAGLWSEPSFADVEKACFQNWCAFCRSNASFIVDECLIENAEQIFTSQNGERVNAAMEFGYTLGVGTNWFIHAQKNPPYGFVATDFDIYLNGKKKRTLFVSSTDSDEALAMARDFKDSNQVKICFKDGQQDCFDYSLEGFSDAIDYWFKLVKKYWAE